MPKKIVVVLFLFLTVFLVIKSFWPLPQEPFPQTEISEIKKIQQAPQEVTPEAPTKTEETSVPVKNNTIKTISIDFERIKKDTPSTAGSIFSKSYKLALEDLELTSKPQTYKIVFDREVKDVTSVVILGSDGQSEITGLKYNDSSQELKDETKTLFPDDWHRSANSFTSLKNIEFVASSKDKGLINIYLQVMGEE